MAGSPGGGEARGRVTKSRLDPEVPDKTADADADAAAKFLTELSDHWQRYGKAAFDAALSKDPVRYVTLAAKLIAGAGARAEKGNDLVTLLAALDDRQ